MEAQSKDGGAGMSTPAAQRAADSVVDSDVFDGYRNQYTKDHIADIIDEEIAEYVSGLPKGG